MRRLLILPSTAIALSACGVPSTCQPRIGDTIDAVLAACGRPTWISSSQYLNRTTESLGWMSFPFSTARVSVSFTDGRVDYVRITR